MFYSLLTDILIRMSTPTPKGISPRFSCDHNQFTDIAAALHSIGHVVIENVFDEQTLSICGAYAANLFKKVEDDYQAGKYTTAGEINSYFGSTFSFASDPEGTKHLELFMDMIERSPILNLFTFLLNGNVAAIHGPVLRRVDPTIPFRHIGLHSDNQVNEYTNHGYNSNCSYTTWTPLCDIDETTARLFLLGRDIQFEDPLMNMKTPTTVDKVSICSKKNKETHLDITPLYLSKLPRKELSPEELVKLNNEYHEYTNSLIDKLGEAAYAPQLKMNSVVVFLNDVIHGSFSHDGLTRPRHSADIRFIGDFDKSVNYERKERAFIFKRYIRQAYDPFLENEPPVASFDSLQTQIKVFHQQLAQQQQQLALLQARSIVGQLKKILRPIIKPVLKSLRLRS